MNPIELIKNEIGAEEWSRCLDSCVENRVIQLQEGLDLFESHKIYRVLGKTQQFDFTMLPRGSFCYFAANGREAIRLTKSGKEIERILGENFLTLPRQNPVGLASFILRFFGDGIKASHHVLAGEEDLAAMCSGKNSYLINATELTNSSPRLGRTELSFDEGSIRIRALTLCGWMHSKQNLGIEVITVSQEGRVHLGVRDVLSEKIFTQVPRILY